MLDYYSTDYAPIGGSGPDAFRSGKNGSGYGGNIIDLFNGNISGMTTTLKEPANYTIHPQGTEYYYDQLNRLVEMTVYQDLDRTTNDWDTESPLTDYHEEYSYDANGNILSLLRNGHNTVNTQMDDLIYNYATNNNKLQYVDDAISSGNYPTDIDDQATNNYDYDQIGNLIQDNAEEIANIDWTVYGKVKSVTRTMLSTKPELTFTYGPDGQRVTKRVDDGTDIISTYYVRDASGNIMATYKYIDHSVAADEFLLEEHHIYGSTRLGTRQKQTDLLTSPTIPPDQTGIIYVERGYKRYELTNHLGNVLSVVSDRRQQGACTGDIVDYYEADIINVQDYYPFGMTMSEREWSNGDYRFGFNGMEKTDEVYGAGNEYTTEFRQYDPRLGRWLSLDPEMLTFPWMSPYAAINNNPILYTDKKGDNPIVIGVVIGAEEVITAVVIVTAGVIIHDAILGIQENAMNHDPEAAARWQKKQGIKTKAEIEAWKITMQKVIEENLPNSDPSDPDNQKIWEKLGKAGVAIFTGTVLLYDNVKEQIKKMYENKQKEYQEVEDKISELKKEQSNSSTTEDRKKLINGEIVELGKQSKELSFEVESLGDLVDEYENTIIQTEEHGAYGTFGGGVMEQDATGGYTPKLEILTAPETIELPK